MAFARFVLKHFKEDTWAEALQTEPGRLADRSVALFSLRMIEAVGRSQAAHWGVRFPK